MLELNKFDITVSTTVAPPNNALIKEVDLSSANSDTSLGISGSGFGIKYFDGNFTLKIQTTGGTILILDSRYIYINDYFKIDFSDILITNTAQAGKKLIIYYDWRS